AGLIIGAGVFALPYAFAKAGIFWGTIHLVFSVFVVYFLHQWYGEVSFYTKGKHRFVGYVEKYLGKKAKVFSAITTMGSYYFSLLVYAIMGGIFLANFTSLFNGHTVEFMTLLFFATGGLMALFKVNKIAEINFYLTLPIFGFIIYLLFFSFPYIKAENFFANDNLLLNKNWFLPYGVWLFSLTGFSAIPPTRDLFIDSDIKKFKRVISISLFLAIFAYILFVFSILGVSGSFATEDALSGIKAFMGVKVMAIGSIIGFLCVFTSFIALAADMKSMFRYDYKIPRFIAWLFVIIPPTALYLFKFDGLVNTLAITGSVGMGILGVFVVLMRHKMVRILKAGDKDDVVAEIDVKEIKIRKKLEIIILIGIVSAVLYDIWRGIFGLR
ncbi:MAG: aromatic amino acid transport family protein, partial [Patescibacteria group bacterium]